MQQEFFNTLSQERTFAKALAVGEKISPELFDHPVRAQQDRWGKFDPERLGGLQVQGQIAPMGSRAGCKGCFLCLERQSTLYRKEGRNIEADPQKRGQRMSTDRVA